MTLDVEGRQLLSKSACRDVQPINFVCAKDEAFRGRYSLLTKVVVRLLGFYQWIHVNKRGGQRSVRRISEQPMCRLQNEARFSGTPHAKDTVRIAETAILIE